MGDSLEPAISEMVEGNTDKREMTAKMYELFFGEKPSEKLLDELMSEKNEEAYKIFMKNIGGAE